MSCPAPCETGADALSSLERWAEQQDKDLTPSTAIRRPRCLGQILLPAFASDSSPYLDRIDGGVQEIGDQIGEDNAEDHDDGDRLHQREAAPVDREQEQAS